MTAKQILLGKIIAPHGLKGEVKIKSFTEDPLDVASYGLVTVRDGRRFRLENARLQGEMNDSGVLADPRRLQATCESLAKAEAEVARLYGRWQELEAGR